MAACHGCDVLVVLMRMGPLGYISSNGRLMTPDSGQQREWSSGMRLRTMPDTPAVIGIGTRRRGVSDAF